MDLEIRNPEEVILEGINRLEKFFKELNLHTTLPESNNE